MDVVGELIQWTRVRSLTPPPRPMAARGALAAVQRAQVPWVLALLPLGSLLAAGLLVMLLSRLVPVPPALPAPDVPAVDIVEPAATFLNVDGDEWNATFEPIYSR